MYQKIFSNEVKCRYFAFVSGCKIWMIDCTEARKGGTQSKIPFRESAALPKRRRAAWRLAKGSERRAAEAASATLPRPVSQRVKLAKSKGKGGRGGEPHPGGTPTSLYPCLQKGTILRDKRMARKGTMPTWGSTYFLKYHILTYFEH